MLSRLKLLKFIDWYLAGGALLLALFGIAVIYSLVISSGKMLLVYNQLSFLIIGIIGGAYLALFDYRKLKNFSFVLYFLVIALLGGVLILGETQFGATRWINVGSIQFQPSEPTKLVLTILLAYSIARWYPNIKLNNLLTILGLAALPVLLILKQPDLGTASILIFVTVAVLIMSKLSRLQWVLLLILGVAAITFLWFNLEDYQLQRVKTFINPTSDPYHAGYNVIQSLIAVGNGGMFGQGFGRGTQSQLEFLPVAHTDFIFAGIAEATGFVGSVVILAIFGLLITRAILAARRASDLFGTFLAASIAVMWLVQGAINVGMTLGLAPVTGIPLPFISYGGTALVTNLLALGILESIVLRSKRLSFYNLAR